MPRRSTKKPDETGTKTCEFCASAFSAERPYNHCMDDLCVRKHLNRQAAGMSMVLMHKVGYVPMFKGDNTQTNKHGG